MVVIRNRRTSTDARTEASEATGGAQAQISPLGPLICVKMAIAGGTSPCTQDERLHVIAARELADPLHDALAMVKQFVAHD